ncbi:hypothetical protein ACRAWD_21300 [Caulobacter segnis]
MAAPGAYDHRRRPRRASSHSTSAPMAARRPARLGKSVRDLGQHLVSGLSAAQTLLARDAGARRPGSPRVARPTTRRLPPTHRLTALQAFEDVENQLTAARTPVPGSTPCNDRGLRAADQTEQSRR